jgi:hypothetical protein
MTNYVDTITNTVVTSLDVLKSVNDMYSSNFVLLVTVMGLLLGLIGAAVVILPLWFQFRENRARRAEMQTEFQKFILDAQKHLEAKQQEKIDELKAWLKEEIESVKVENSKQWARATAFAAHAQMKIAMTSENYAHAAENAFVALRGSCICGDHSNVLRLMECLIDQICPHLKKEDLEERNLMSEFAAAEELLTAENKTGFLTDKLEGFKKAKKEITKRQ